ncbi:hypothetical protein CR205_16040 [Alteribacter lacisalsi]|uniref:Bifunctional metallophosphatase/5'-nucleotidase n=1 Tax=Alteribacter lacisalsi TaxID=2045244 RepID=A0A2W0HQN4_9BACI|nr:cell wall-binding repeat-containing protein [Alteribacter lacisalsi]PYZ95888.1 hypothetical protein CR205_16040 [Alteribacter lacisalsi]
MRKGKKTLTSMMAGVLLASSFFTFGSAGAVQADETQDGVKELKVLHTNDIHARIDPLGKASAYINEERDNAEYSMYLDAGDMFSGNAVVDLLEGVPVVEILNEMELDALAIGNHEFDYGQEAFAARESDSDFDWLSANMEVVDTDIPIEQPDPYEIYEIDDVTVGVLSLTQNPPATAPAGVVGIEFHDYVESALEYEYVRDEVDVYIALTHIGFGADQALAEEVEFFDAIIGGHSHTVLDEPVMVNGTPVAQAGANSEYVGNLTFTLDEDTHEVLGVEGFLQDTESLTETNESVQAIIDHYNDEMDELLSEVIGETNTGLTRDGRYEMDVALGNFWTDSLLYYGEGDIAFTNNGGIRDSIEPGEITKGDIYTIEPFANELMIYEMTGEALHDVIEFSYTRDGRNQIDLQTAGLEYTIHVDAQGNFLEADLYFDGEEIGMDDTYTVVVPDFIGTGGSGYNFEGEVVEPAIGQITTAMFSFAETFEENNEAIDYETTEGRISIEQQEMDREVSRIAGENRYETSLALADEIEDGTLDHVILASGSDYPDALAGGALNQSLNGTVLLVNDNENIMNAAKAKAEELLNDNGSIVILGGEAAVPAIVEETFSETFDVERVYGENRIETSVAIADHVNPDATEMFVVSGFDFADAMSIVPYAAENEIPVLINWDDEGLSDALRVYAHEQGIQSATVVGGPHAVPNGALSELANMGVSVNRVHGENRFETALAVKAAYYPEATSFALANGQDFPDGLSASRLAYDHEMPILLTRQSHLPANVESYIEGKMFENVFLLGGHAAVSEDIEAFFQARKQ